MLHSTRTILGYAGVFTAILDHDMAYVNMTNYISMHGDVLSDHKSAKRRQRNTMRTDALVRKTFEWPTRRMRAVCNAICILYSYTRVFVFILLHI